MPSLLPSVAALVLATGEDELDAAYARDLGPLLQSYCVDCHGEIEPEAEICLEGRDPTGLRAELGLLQTLRRALAHRVMPPPEMDAPSDDERARAVEWLDRALIAAHPEGSLPPIVVRRLSREEYARTVRDLLGVDLDVRDGLPYDDLGHGFDNIGASLTTSVLHLEHYVEAAERLADAALILEDPRRPAVQHYLAEEMETELRSSSRSGGWRVLYTAASLDARPRLPRDGEYEIRLRAYGEQAGPDPVRMDLRIDGRRQQEWSVLADAGAPAVFRHRLRLTAGTHHLAVGFLNDFYQADHPDPEQRDRNLAVQWVELTGPLDPPPMRESHRAIMSADPGPFDPEGRVRTSRERLAAILQPLARRAFRRPLDPVELDRLVELAVLEVEADGALVDGVHLALQAILASPQFLYRLEGGPVAASSDDDETGLDDHELATRLSYFLWSSMPDDELFEAASRGQLHTPAALEQQTRRMLRDPRARALAENFAAQWLELRNLEQHAPDHDAFPDVDADLLTSMRKESEALFASILFDERPLSDLLDSTTTSLDERLARHYGIDGVEGPEFRPVNVDDPRRHGILGHASVLTLTSNPTRTSPVKRGQWILAQLLDAPPAPPPPDAGSLDESEEAIQSSSLRERLEQHRRDPSCAACHARMDALGFSLENFDAVGRWRTEDGPFPIDARATLPDGRELRGPNELRRAILDDEALVRTLSRKLYVYALGRGLDPRDEPILDELGRGLVARDTTLTDIILRIVATEAFRRRGRPLEAETGS